MKMHNFPEAIRSKNEFNMFFEIWKFQVISIFHFRFVTARKTIGFFQTSFYTLERCSGIRVFEKDNEKPVFYKKYDRNLLKFGT